MTAGDKTESRKRAAECLRKAADEPGLPDWLRQVLQLAAADPQALETPEAKSPGRVNFVYFH